MGGRIVAEVLYGLIEGDSLPYLGPDPEWTPTYGSNGNFTIVDLPHHVRHRRDPDVAHTRTQLGTVSPVTSIHRPDPTSGDIP